MSRSPSRLLIPAVTLVAFLFLSPSLATALPQGATLNSVAGHSVESPDLFARLWDLLSAIWENGSILEPDGTGSGASSGPGTEPESGTSADNGPGLDPDG